MKLHWGNAIFIFFTLFISLNIVFIVFSFRQDIELVDKDYYEKGANYTHHMKIQKRSVAYNDSIFATDSENNIVIALPISFKQNIKELDLYFYNPSSKSKDYNRHITSITDTLFIEKTHIASGRYTIKIKWTMNQDDYLVEKVIDIN